MQEFHRTQRSVAKHHRQWPGWHWNEQQSHIPELQSCLWRMGSFISHDISWLRCWRCWAGVKENRKPDVEILRIVSDQNWKKNSRGSDAGSHQGTNARGREKVDWKRPLDLAPRELPVTQNCNFSTTKSHTKNKVGKRKWKHKSPWEKVKKPRQFTIRSNYLQHCYFLYPFELTQWQRRESPFLLVDDEFHEVTWALIWYVQWFREGASLLLIKIMVHLKAWKYTKWQLLKCPINCMDICSKLLLWGSKVQKVGGSPSWGQGCFARPSF